MESTTARPSGAPDDLANIIATRLENLEALRASPVALAATRIHYASNPADFIDDWLWTYDPRRQDGPPHMPFVLWPRQREYIAWLQERMATRTGGLVEKSRDMGVTYLSLAFALHLWLFHPGSKVGFGSRKADLVDRIGDPDTLFEKLRMMLRDVPPEFMPKDYCEETDAPSMKLLNRANGASITGEGGDQIGRGGRSTLFFVDEAAYLEHPMKVEASLSNNTDVRIDVSSPNGNANPFYRKRMSGRVPVFTFHWTSDPRKDDAWHEQKRRELDPVVFASEIEIDYNASAEDVCIPAMYVQAAIGLKLPREGMKRGGLDVADEGGDMNAYVGIHGVCIDKIEGWREGTTTQTARRGNEMSRAHGDEILRYDKVGVGAGVKGEMEELRRSGLAVPFEGINTGSSPPPGRCPETGLKNGDRYKNLRAYAWWMMRRRFIRTYEHVNGIAEHDTSELIALPTQEECPLVMELVAEFSRPKAFRAEDGKIQIEAKKKMKGGSPNYADAAILDFVEVRAVNPMELVRLR